jgi:phosphate transport system substrate-binding protein
MKRKISALIAGLLVLSAFAAGCNNSGSTGSSINVVSREEGSGTRGAFIELFGIEKKDENGNKVDHTTDSAEISNSTTVVMTTVAGDENAIGYISLGSLNDTVKALEIDGAAATVDNIKNGTYKVQRPFNIATKPEPGELAADFVAFIMSAEGQTVIEEKGYISVDSTAAPYAGTKPSGTITVAGSSSVTPVMEALKEAYLQINSGATIEVQQSDSTTGMTSAIEGIADIGMASRALKDSELSAGIVPTTIALDGIAVIVNKGNAANSLTSGQVTEIFTGEITKWSEISAD